MDDKEKLSKFVRSEEGIFFLKNALVFEEGQATFLEGDFVRLRDGEMESLYHLRAAYKDGEVDGKEESFNLSSLCAFENTVAFCTQKEGDSILHLYDGELLSRELKESIDSLILLKDYGLCTLFTPDSSTNLYTVNLETLDFVQQSAELEEAWKWPLQYDEFLSVIYEKESLSQKEEQGVIKALWIDDKGSVKTQEIFRTEPRDPEVIKESFGVISGSYHISLVEKKGEEGTPEKEWSLVLYPGTK